MGEKSLKVLFEDLLHQLGDATLANYGPSKYMFAATVAFIVQADMSYMWGKTMDNANKLEAIARALSLVEYSDALGDHKGRVLGVVNGVLERHAICVSNNVTALNKLMESEGFDATRRAALDELIENARASIEGPPTILFDMPPLEA